MLRKYILCSSSARESIDVRKSEKKILKAVLDVKPDTQVHVEKDCYYADLTRGEAIRVTPIVIIGQHPIIIATSIDVIRVDARRKFIKKLRIAPKINRRGITRKRLEKNERRINRKTSMG